MGIVDFIFPKHCLSCKREGKYFCEACVEKVGSPGVICATCHKFSGQGLTHPSCICSNSLDKLTCIWNYQGIIRKGIKKLKYSFVKDLSEEMAKLLDKNLDKEFENNLVLTSIPLHKKRQRWRGFNQAEEIARLIAEKRAWQFLPKLIQRKLQTKPQTYLRGVQREKNIEGAYAFNGFIAQKLKNKDLVVVFDDVYTTGATLKEAAKLLKENNIKRVWGLTLAR